MPVRRDVRVLILTTTFLPTVGGLQYELKWFLDNLDRRLPHRARLDAHFVLPNAESRPFANFQAIATYDLGLARLGRGSLVRALPRLAQLFRTVRPDIVHCHGLRPDGLLASLAADIGRARAKVVVTSHGQDIVRIPALSYGPSGGAVSRLVERYVTRRLSAHVLVSSAMLSHAVAAGTPRHKAAVINDGIPIDDDHDFEIDAASHSRRGDHREPDTGAGLVFLSLSSGREVKNLAALIEAFDRARNRIGRSRLVLACTGPQAAAIRRQVTAKKLDAHVSFIGEVTGSRKHEVFAASHVYCLPSLFESFGLVVLEAMKFGAVPLASSVGGIPEIIEHEHNGLLVCPADPAAMADSMVRLYRDPGLRTRLAKGGRDTVARYSISRTVDQYIALYDRLFSADRV